MTDGISVLQMTANQPMWVLTSVLSRFSIRQLLIGGVFLVLLDAVWQGEYPARQETQTLIVFASTGMSLTV